MAIESLFDDTWVSRVTSANNSWVSEVIDNINGAGGVYLKCISSWFYELTGSNKEKKDLKERLKSADNVQHLGAVNELSWWAFLKSIGFTVEPIYNSKLKTPDFVIKQADSTDVFFEVTTLNPTNPQNGSQNLTEISSSQISSLNRIGVKVWEEKKEQLKFGWKQQCPLALVLFNYDEWSGFGTQFHRLIDVATLFPNAGPELSAIIYLERYVINGKPRFKKDSIVILDNPNAAFPLAVDIKERIVGVSCNHNWIDCDND